MPRRQSWTQISSSCRDLQQPIGPWPHPTTCWVLTRSESSEVGEYALDSEHMKLPPPGRLCTFFAGRKASLPSRAMMQWLIAQIHQLYLISFPPWRAMDLTTVDVMLIGSITKIMNACTNQIHVFVCCEELIGPAEYEIAKYNGQPWIFVQQQQPQSGWYFDREFAN